MSKMRKVVLSGGIYDGRTMKGPASHPFIKTKGYLYVPTGQMVGDHEVFAFAGHESEKVDLILPESVQRGRHDPDEMVTALHVRPRDGGGAELIRATGRRGGGEPMKMEVLDVRQNYPSKPEAEAWMREFTSAGSQFVDRSQ